MGGIVSALLIGELGARVHEHFANKELLSESSLPDTDLANQEIVKRSLGEIVRLVDDDSIIYALKPGTRYLYSSAVVHTSSLGFRVRSEAQQLQQRDQNSRAFVAIGDSILWGQGVSYKSTFFGLLEEEVTTHRERYGDWQFFNMGVPGYNLMMEVAALKQHLAYLRPSVVLYAYCSNDTEIPRFLHSAATVYDYKRSFLFDFLMQRLFALSTSPQGLFNTQYLKSEEGEDAYTQRIPKRYHHLYGVKNFQESFKELVLLSKKHNFHLVVSTLDTAPEYLRDVVTSYGVPLVDSHEKIQRYMQLHNLTEDDVIVSKTDPHPNYVQHRIAYEELGQFFSKNMSTIP